MQVAAECYPIGGEIVPCFPRLAGQVGGIKRLGHITTTQDARVVTSPKHRFPELLLVWPRFAQRQDGFPHRLCVDRIAVCFEDFIVLEDLKVIELGDSVFELAYLSRGTNHMLLVGQENSLTHNEAVTSLPVGSRIIGYDQHLPIRSSIDTPPPRTSPNAGLRGALGLPKPSIPDPDIRMPKFGSMSVTLADRQVPPPFKEGKVDEAFFDYAAAMVQAAPGRTLVLVASYDNVERIASRVPGLIKHVRGEPLGRFVEDFKTNGGKLITPVAWEGLDLPHFIDDVVIVRLPLAPQSELRQTILEGFDRPTSASGSLNERLRRKTLATG